MEDHYTCTDIDAMEDIARKVPLSRINRPLWDKELLEDLDCSKVEIEEDVWKRVWSREERANYYSTPMFLVEGGENKSHSCPLEGNVLKYLLRKT